MSRKIREVYTSLRKIQIRNQQKMGNGKMFNQQFKIRNIKHEEMPYEFNNMFYGVTVGASAEGTIHISHHC